jgi:hypothetical protein
LLHWIIIALFEWFDKRRVASEMQESEFGVQSQMDLANTKRSFFNSELQRTTIFLFVTLIAFYFFTLLIPLLIPLGRSTFLRDPDVYWHVAVGRMIWQMGALPHYDQLSHTFYGHPWIAKEWLGQLFFFSAYEFAGWRGVALLTASVVALAYALLFLVLARSMRLTVAIGISAVAFTFSLGLFNARPLVFADPLIVIWFASLVRAVEAKKSPNRLLWLLMVLWANVHASFTFGLAIAAVLAAEAFFGSSADERLVTAKRWAIFLAGALCAACITPYGYKPILATYQVFVGNEALQYYTHEWQPAVLDAKSFNGRIIFLLLFLGLYHGVKLPFWRLTAFIFLLYLLFAHVRFAALFAIVAPILLAIPLIEQFSFLRLSRQIETDPAFFEVLARVSKRGLFPVGSLIAASLVAFGAYGPTMAPEAKITPEGAVDYIYKHQLVGNIYNPLNFGGYLMFRGVKTFIDGRTDQLFLENFWTKLNDVVYHHPKEFIPYLMGYSVKLAVVIPNSVDAQELERSADWQKVYSDSVSELFQRRH